MDSKVFGGKTLLKWQEPHALLTKYVLAGGFSVLLAGSFILMTRSARETGHLFAARPDLLFLMIVGFVVFAGLSGVRTIRLKELRIATSDGQNAHIRNYCDIEMAVVQEGSCNFEECIVITFKLKGDASIRGLNQIAIPDSVDLDQVIRFLRDKGVGVENEITGEYFG